MSEAEQGTASASLVHTCYTVGRFPAASQQNRHVDLDE